MTQPTSMLQRLDPRMLDPDALEQVTTQAMVAPGQDDATRGFIGATLPYLTRMRQQRAADYTSGVNETNQLQSMMQQRALQEAARKTNVEAGLKLSELGFTPQATTDLGATLAPGALSNILSTQGLRDKGLQGKIAKDFADASKAQSESDAAMSPETLTQASGLKFEPNTANSLERARIAASAKGSGGNARIEFAIPVGGTPGTLKLSGGDPAALQQQAEDIQRASGGQGEGLPPKAAAALTARKLPLTGYTKAADGSFVKVAKDGSVLRVTPQGDIFDNGQKVK